MSKRTVRLHRLSREHGWFCRYCGKPVIEPMHKEMLRHDHATLDHVISLVDGGKDHIDNIVIACRDCNGWKGGHSIKNIDTYSDVDLKEIVYSLQFQPTPDATDGLNRKKRLKIQKKMQENRRCRGKRKKMCSLVNFSDIKRCIEGHNIICPKMLWLKGAQPLVD